MSNRQRPRRNSEPAPDLLEVLVGTAAPGGCDDCSAYQTFTEPEPRLYALTTHHDGSCPFYAGVTS